MCGQEKAASAFYTNFRMRDGLSSYCRDCTRDYGRKWKKGFRIISPERKANPLYRQTATQSAHTRRHRGRHPERAAARNVLHGAIRAGRAAIGDHCDACGKPCRPHGHHVDYAQPFLVAWLCGLCHRMVHAGTIRCPEPSLIEVVPPMSKSEAGGMSYKTRRGKDLAGRKIAP